MNVGSAGFIQINYYLTVAGVEEKQAGDTIASPRLWLFHPAEPGSMFGYQGGENGETVARKRGYMVEAQQRWPFLTAFDMTTIHNERQLATLVRDRTGLPKVQADADVHSWMTGKTF